MYKRRNYRKRKHREIFLIFFFTILLIATGYAAFQTILNINVSGHIYVTPDSCFTVSDNGDGTGTITNYDMECGKKVVIPDVINNLTITRIADYNSETAHVFYGKDVTYVKLPGNLSYIGEKSFYASRISKISLPNSMRVIGKRAFQESTLSQINLNYGLTTLEAACFENTLLEHLLIPSTVKNLNSTIAINNYLVGEEAFIYSRDENGIVDYTSLISYGNGRNVENVMVPEGIKNIGKYSFSGRSIKSIYFPNTIENISNDCMVNVFNLKNLYIGKNIKNIGSLAFQYVPSGITINIDRSENAVSGAPWGASNATVNWIGNN